MDHEKHNLERTENTRPESEKFKLMMENIQSLQNIKTLENFSLYENLIL